MKNSDNINELVEKLIHCLPEGLKNLPQDLSSNFHQLIEGSFNKFNRVTREEFDAQVGVLQRTRQKLEQLEERLKELES